MQKLGSEGMSFATIMLFTRERSALPHGNPSDQVLKQGDFVTLDFGAVVNGYSDMTRRLHHWRSVRKTNPYL